MIQSTLPCPQLQYELCQVQQSELRMIHIQHAADVCEPVPSERSSKYLQFRILAARQPTSEALLPRCSDGTPEFDARGARLPAVAEATTPKCLGGSHALDERMRSKRELAVDLLHLSA